ncbi:MAG: DUF4437 domain-containing protein [Acidobacteriota bacterium]
MSSLAQDAAPKTATGSEIEALAISDVDWGALNPARGDQGPRAATLWGDRTSPGPSGFLVAFRDGFSSPPHIHNVSYRGVVVYGLVHNDDPAAKTMWMPTGSYWTQPAGEEHITSARGETNLAYIEIEDGPYLVRPSEQAFDNGERPVNVDPSNIIWLNASSLRWIDPADTQTGAQVDSQTSGEEAQLAFLWGDPQVDELSGSLVKLSAGSRVRLTGGDSMLRAVVIQGQLQLQGLGESHGKDLQPGSYFGSEVKAVHELSCDAEEACVLYVRTQGQLTIS